MDVRWQSNETRKGRQTQHFVGCTVWFQTAIEQQVVRRIAVMEGLNLDVVGTTCSRPSVDADGRKVEIGWSTTTYADGSGTTGAEAREYLQLHVIDVWQRILDEQRPLILVAEMLSEAMNGVIHRQRKEIDDLGRTVDQTQKQLNAHARNLDSLSELGDDIVDRVVRLEDRTQGEQTLADMVPDEEQVEHMLLRIRHIRQDLDVLEQLAGNGHP